MRIAVVGAGSWGTALAVHLDRGEHDVSLWVRDPVLAGEIRFVGENRRYLPTVPVPARIRPTPHLADAVAGAEMVVVVVPSEFTRAVYAQIRHAAPLGAILVSATKGIETDSLLRMTEVAREEDPDRAVAVLSGPSFALEVGLGQPTTVVVGAEDPAVGMAVQRAFSSRRFRAYTTDDVVGVELGGALKNVIAIAAGIITGLGYGSNTGAALITRGLAEMSRLAVARGGRAETLAGLAGLGDLVLTCTGALSRNRKLGQALGAGRTLTEALAGSPMVVEGVRTTLAACALAEQAGIDMPIAQQMRAVIYGGKSPADAVDELMLRSLKRE